ncbi:alkyl sulfatase dimerization domain-containing protein [Vibrio sp. 10N.261.52.A1]|uniref:alkyl/aryl-sulfatase n=1 Tax=Vibrio TaxID=662 RepID=UPI000C848A16|nr:alkyl sulfatase dimerization domain-containing protein [Vibrio sp. 10N.261.52.A1]PML52329.1 alkyl sulfatase [Vibrio sp. 10N.261.52.A1]
MKKTILALTISAISCGAIADSDYGSLDTYMGKAATEHTAAANKSLDKTLPWEDVSAFERSERGLIAAFDDHDAGRLRNSMAHLNVKDMRADRPDTVNPSIWRQAQMNYASGGLYQVNEGVYQLRGADLSNITIYKADNGYIIHDPLLKAEAASAAWAFAKEHLPKINGKHNIVGMIYSHTHPDHFGGSRGIIESGDWVEGSPIIAPDGFMREFADENVLAGAAMGRRASYQYGSDLPTNETGIVDNALGMGLAEGNVTFVPPTQFIVEREETVVIDGLEMLFINMPGAEAPVEIVNYVPKYRSLNTAELTYDGQHNVYTFRGAKVRDTAAWTKYLTELKMRFVDSGLVDDIHAAHSAPVWGQEEISEYMGLQRDNYGWLHNNTMRLANHGVKIHDVGREIDKIIPKTQLQTWHTNGYHGSYSHNARAIMNLYLGYHDLNPINTNPLQSTDRACMYVEVSGEGKLFEAGTEYFNKGQYQEAAELFNNLVTCDPTNVTYREKLADTFEQQGYQSETMAWRNSYLQGAVELRTGTIGSGTKTASADVIANTPTSNFLDLVGVQLNGPKAEELGLDFNMTIVHPDVNETHYVEVSNAAMSNISVTELGLKDNLPKLDTQLIVNKSDLTRVLLGETTLDKLVEAGQAGIKGDAANIKQLASALDQFDGKFEILPLGLEK